MKPKHIFYFFILILVLISSAAPASASPPQILPPGHEHLSPGHGHLPQDHEHLPPLPLEHFIYTEDDLKNMFHVSGGDLFHLMNDIEIYALTWNPIGSAERPFRALF